MYHIVYKRGGSGIPRSWADTLAFLRIVRTHPSLWPYGLDSVSRVERVYV